MMPLRRRGSRPLALLAALALLGGACSGDGDGGEGAQVGTDATSQPTAPPSVDDVVEGLGLVQGGKLTACTHVSDAPFAFEDNGQLDGIDIELVRALAGRLGLEPVFRDVESDAVLASLDDRQCDLAASAVRITDERRESFEFSEPYFRIDQSLLVRKGDEATYGELVNLAGRALGVQSGTTGAAYAKANAGGATVREFSGSDELFAALEAGQVDAALHDLPVNAHQALTTGRTVVAKVLDEPQKAEYGLAMRKGDTALKKAVDDALAEARSDDTYPTILRRFLGDTAGQI